MSKHLKGPKITLDSRGLIIMGKTNGKNNSGTKAAEKVAGTGALYMYIKTKLF